MIIKKLRRRILYLTLLYLTLLYLSALYHIGYIVITAVSDMDRK